MSKTNTNIYPKAGNSDEKPLIDQTKNTIEEIFKICPDWKEGCTGAVYDLLQNNGSDGINGDSFVQLTDNFKEYFFMPENQNPFLDHSGYSSNYFYLMLHALENFFSTLSHESASIAVDLYEMEQHPESVSQNRLFHHHPRLNRTLEDLKSRA